MKATTISALFLAATATAAYPCANPECPVHHPSDPPGPPVPYVCPDGDPGPPGPWIIDLPGMDEDELIPDPDDPDEWRSLPANYGSLLVLNLSGYGWFVLSDE